MESNQRKIVSYLTEEQLREASSSMYLNLLKRLDNAIEEALRKNNFVIAWDEIMEIENELIGKKTEGFMYVFWAAREFTARNTFGGRNRWGKIKRALLFWKKA